MLDARSIEAGDECLLEFKPAIGRQADDERSAAKVTQRTTVEGEPAEIHPVVIGIRLAGVSCGSGPAIAIALFQAQRGVQSG